MKKKMLIVSLVIAILCIVAGLLIFKHQPDQKALAAALLKQMKAGQTKFNAPPRPAHLNPSGATGDKDNRDPVARVAMSLVGIDADAETYWITAINDSTLSAAERENLISDLNEDGLSDFKHPAADDLPVIQKRIALIDKLAPDAMDQVNAVAFKEARADLMNLAEVAQGRGKPVQ